MILNWFFSVNWLNFWGNAFVLVFHSFVIKISCSKIIFRTHQKHLQQFVHCTYAAYGTKPRLHFNFQYLYLYFRKIVEYFHVGGCQLYCIPLFVPSVIPF